MFIRHSIDLFNNRYISGWIFNRLHKSKPIILRFTSDGKDIGNIIANIYRKDLQINGVHPSGNCGFNFNFPQDVNITRATTLDVFINNRKIPFLRLPTNRLSSVKQHNLPKIMFMHIPKTAGTSFNAFMRLHLHHQKIHIHLEGINSQEYKQLEKKCTYLAGHLTLQKLYSFFAVSSFECFSLIREPSAHLHSHLNWLKGIGSHEKSNLFKQHNATIQKLAKKVTQLDFDDVEAVDNFVHTLKDYELDFFDNCQTRYFLDHRPEKVVPANVSEAIDNSKLFKLIGITEQYNEFLEKFSSLYNLEIIVQPSSFNKAIEPDLYDYNAPDMKNLLAPLIEADILFYDWIKKTQWSS
ncbi:MAG: hypothetical protein GY705_22760 [Bacteroidetes bacterium]|nr:hypothetical protein [Bacteroidota bacterium]